MKLPDDEIRSKCQARYHATPEPVHDDFDTWVHQAQQVPGVLLGVALKTKTALAPAAAIARSINNT